MDARKNRGGVSRRTFLAGAAVVATGALGRQSRIVADDAVPVAPIAKRPFGKTGAQISIVGLGAGSRFYRSIPDDEQAADLVRRSIEMGVEFMETSANYGPDGLSERRIGLAMKTHRSRVFLETKVDERTYDGAMREMERSLERLNTDHLDLVLHHFLGAGGVDEVLGRQGAERALRDMVDQGVVRFRGLSTHLPEVALDAMERLEPDGMQLPINAVRVPDFEPDVLSEAEERGVAVIAMKTCGHGYFFRANATVPDRIEQFGPPSGALERWDLPTPREYTHYALSLPIATATIGIDSHHTLESVVATVQDFAPITPEQKASVSERAQVFATTGYWVPRDEAGTGEAPGPSTQT